MAAKAGVRPEASVGEALSAFAHDILAEARAALDNRQKSDAVAVHDFRKAMKRWRALLRLLQPSVGDEAYRLRVAARDLARELAVARDSQAALDALADIGKADGFSSRSLATIGARLEAMRQSAETTTLTDATRSRLRAAIAAAEGALTSWRVQDVRFSTVADALAEGFRRARNLVPDDWPQADEEELHELRQRVVVHRYQMELVEPLWPRLGRMWVSEAQRLRERLGACQDLAVLQKLTAPHQPLAPWRSRLAPVIAARRAVHVAAAARLVAHLFAERPRAFRRRLVALWETRRRAAVASHD